MSSYPNRNNDIEHDSAPDPTDAQPNLYEALKHYMALQNQTDAELLRIIQEQRSDITRLQARIDWLTGELSTVRNIAQRAARNSDYEVPQL